ncbi:hypothetical protein BASA62_007158 [Batrachochytrium salamandrivorans]|nr:hypothetical protein BASA62_007158 [Batrachochytrium salamandrivorans]
MQLLTRSRGSWDMLTVALTAVVSHWIVFPMAAVAQTLPSSSLLDPLAYAALITFQPCPSVNNSASANIDCSYPSTPTTGQVTWTCEAG